MSTIDSLEYYKANMSNLTNNMLLYSFGMQCSQCMINSLLGNYDRNYSINSFIQHMKDKQHLIHSLYNQNILEYWHSILHKYHLIDSYPCYTEYNYQQILCSFDSLNYMICMSMSQSNNIQKGIPHNAFANWQEKCIVYNCLDKEHSSLLQEIVHSQTNRKCKQLNLYTLNSYYNKYYMTSIFN